MTTRSPQPLREEGPSARRIQLFEYAIAIFAVCAVGISGLQASHRPIEQSPAPLTIDQQHKEIQAPAAQRTPVDFYQSPRAALSPHAETHLNVTPLTTSAPAPQALRGVELGPSFPVVFTATDSARRNASGELLLDSDIEQVHESDPPRLISNEDLQIFFEAVLPDPPEGIEPLSPEHMAWFRQKRIEAFLSPDSLADTDEAAEQTGSDDGEPGLIDNGSIGAATEYIEPAPADSELY